MKKILLLILTVVLEIIFVFTSLFGVNILLYSNVWNYEVAWYLMVGILVCMSLEIVGIELLNRKYDKSKDYLNQKQYISRWTKNTVFISLVLCYMDAYVFLFIKNIDSLNLTQQYMYCVFMLLVVWAVVFYVRNYKHHLPRKVRIFSLKNKNVKYKNRRYTFFVEDVNDNEQYVYLKGILSGCMKQFDKVYVYSSKENILTTRILSINENNKVVKESKDKEIIIKVKKNKNTEIINKYSVLSDIKECKEKSQENNIEHPYIRGLITGYEKYHEDHEYMTLLLWKLAFSNFMLCAKATSEHDGDVMDALTGNINAAFLSVSTSIDSTMLILPVFTDWEALEQWSLLMKEKDAVTLINEYHEIVDIMKKGFHGIVINPFGPQPFYLPELLVDSINKMYIEAQKENS